MDITDLDLGVGRSLARPTRSSVIADSLKESGKRIRASKKIIGGGGFGKRHGEQAFKFTIMISAVVLFIIPSLLISIYFSYMASDQFQSETQLLVRKGAGSSLSIASLGGAFSDGAQESKIVQNYIYSRDMINFLNEELDLRVVFSRPDADFFARFDRSLPIEDLSEYWKRKIDVNLDKVSGVLTIAVRAFSPADAQLINNAILKRSEDLVNELSQKARADALAQSEHELKAAQDAVRNAGVKMAELRNKEGLIDPQAQVKALTEVLTASRQQLITLQAKRQALLEGSGAGGPQLEVMARQIGSLADEIAKVEKHITSTGANEDPQSLSFKIGAFDQSNLEREIAQKRYASAAISYERARRAVASKQVYVAVLTAPTRPESSEYPQRAWIITISIMVCAALWGAFVGLASLVRNHLAA